MRLILFLFVSGCGISALDATTRAIGAERTAHNAAVEAARVAATHGATTVGRECIEEHGPVMDCTTAVATYLGGWRELEAGTEDAALASESLAVAVLRWAQAVDDGEGDDDELPLDVRTELETFCPVVSAWLDRMVERGLNVPSLVMSAVDGVCGG